MNSPANFDDMLDAKEPFALFRAWFAEVLTTTTPEPTAMTLATADAAGRPSARIVLLKHHDEQGFVFYTNKTSRKSREISENPWVSLCFYWGMISRQVRITGKAKPVDDAQADLYFASRPRGSQLAAWASRQSQELPERDSFTQRLLEMQQRYEGKDVPRPDFWSGYCIEPEQIEFWRLKDFRTHDRVLFRRQEKQWERHYLYP